MLLLPFIGNEKYFVGSVLQRQKATSSFVKEIPLTHNRAMRYVYAAVYMRYSLFWDVTQSRLVNSYRNFQTTLFHICKGQAVLYLSITNKTQRYTIFFIIVNALHVSGGFSAHHQEFKNCTHSNGYVPAASKPGPYPMLCV